MYRVFFFCFLLQSVPSRVTRWRTFLLDLTGKIEGTWELGRPRFVTCSFNDLSRNYYIIIYIYILYYYHEAFFRKPMSLQLFTTVFPNVVLRALEAFSFYRQVLRVLCSETFAQRLRLKASNHRTIVDIGFDIGQWSNNCLDRSDVHMVHMVQGCSGMFRGSCSMLCGTGTTFRTSGVISFCFPCMCFAGFDFTFQIQLAHLAPAKSHLPRHLAQTQRPTFSAQQAFLNIFECIKFNASFQDSQHQNAACKSFILYHTIIHISTHFIENQKVSKSSTPIVLILCACGS